MTNLQQRLESEGWKFLGNYSAPPGEGRHLLESRHFLFTYFIDEARAKSTLRAGLRDHFKMYPEIRIEDAYDRSGRYLPSLAAVYVRGERGAPKPIPQHGIEPRNRNAPKTHPPDAKRSVDNARPCSTD
ncbi:hypothetical protein C4580_04235 [Candidatus Woesearchaeota archaeon]|nr:MAG: hypothetical protein C4580_04235 [Candidatus Woesearchaeota archaeon]